MGREVEGNIQAESTTLLSLGNSKPDHRIRQEGSSALLIWESIELEAD